MYDELGRFEVTGLEPPTSGELEAPLGYSFSPITRDFDGRLRRTERLPIDHPVDGLAIELFALPALVAHVVDAEGAPIESGRAWVNGISQSGGFSIEHTFGDGALRIALQLEPSAGLEITLVDETVPERRRFAHRRVAEPIIGRYDFGTIVLERAPVWRYRLRDATGAPVPGAAFAAIVNGERHGELERVGVADGDLATMDPAADELLVAADGFKPCFIPLAGHPSDRLLDIVLDRTNELVLLIQSELGSERIALTAARMPFDAATLRSIWFQAIPRFAFELVESSDSPDGWHGEITCWTDRPPRLQGLIPGIAIDFTLLDPLGAACGATCVVLGAEEERVVALERTLPLRPLIARVVDEQGEPIEGAWIGVRAGEDPDLGTCSASSDASGRVETPRFAAQRVVVTATAREFAMRTWRDVGVPPDGSEVRLELARGWRLAIEFAGSDGAPLPPRFRESVEASTIPVGRSARDGERFDAEWTSDGALCFDGLPRAPCDLNIEFAGRHFEQRVEPPTERVLIELPATGRAVVNWELPISVEGPRHRELAAITLEPLAPLEGDREITLEVTRFDPRRRAGALEFQALLPGRYRIVLRFGDSLERDPTDAELEIQADTTAEVSITR